VDTGVVVVDETVVVVLVEVDEVVDDVLEVVLLVLVAGRVSERTWLFVRVIYLAGIDCTNHSDTGKYTGTRK
jgi:hypothetical protein